MNAPPFPVNPAVGERHGNWVWNGARWICAPTTGIEARVQVFAASGPYMPSPGLVTAVVEVWGGGGGGGGANVGGQFTAMGGGGGGSGGYSKSFLPAALVLGGVNVTIGGGGSAGTIKGANGGGGGQTTFGALCMANGGGGGVSAWAEATGASSGYGGDPAGSGAGDIIIPGNAGQTGGYTLLSEEVEVSGGMGGVAPCSGGVLAVAATLAGTGVAAPGPNGGGPGAGAGGGAIASPATTINGGIGAVGLCVVTEYCWATGEDDCLNPPLEVNARVAVTHVPWTGPGPCPPGWGGGPYVDPRSGYIESDE